MEVGQPGAVFLGDPARLAAPLPVVAVATAQGQEQVPQPPAARLRLQLVDHRRSLPDLAGRRRLLDLLGEDGLGRVDMGVHEVKQLAPELLSPRVVSEFHRRLPVSPATIPTDQYWG